MENKPKEKSRLRRWVSRLRIRYRFVVVDDATFDEKWSVRLSPMFFILFLGLGAIVIVLVTTFIIAWTPLREYIPGYPNGTERQSIVENKVKLDSLEAKLNEQSFYIDRVKTIINGGIVPDNSRESDSLIKPLNPGELKKANTQEKEFRKEVEKKENRYKDVNPSSGSSNSGGLAYFYVPAAGVISQSFNPKKNHNGVDISTTKDEPVKAALDGTVVFSGYTSEGGYEIHLQHTNDIVTIYKHNSYLFAQTGQHVRAGETIALSGNTGEQSKGNHVHFEIWDNGMAVDPEEYVGF
jgi:murein DD-endopeptidase MepM/ murein hydrolase activator NlpD